MQQVQHSSGPVADALRMARLGHAPDAKRALRALVESQPSNFAAVQALGMVELRSGNVRGAIPHLRAAIALCRDAFEAHDALSIALASQNENRAAIFHCTRAIALRPDVSAPLERLIQLHFTELRPDDALKAAEDAARAHPEIGFTHGIHAAVLRSLGRIDDARAAAERAIDAEPGNVQHYYLLAQLGRFRPDEPHVRRMEALRLKSASMTAADRAALLFALAKALSDTGDEDTAFDLLDEANRLMRRDMAYDEARTLAAFARVKAVFTPELLRSKGGLGHPSTAPVFIVGMPRSGTTLVEQILASHPRIAGAGEIFVTPQAVRQFVPAFPDGAVMLDAQAAASIGSEYLAGVGRLLASADRVADKTLTNALFAGILHLALPNARFIRVVRDPVDTCISCYSRRFTDGLDFTYDLGELGRYYRAHDDLAAYWERVLPPATMITVRHEDLVADPEGVTRRMIAHVGLPWDDACLAPERSRRPVFTASATQVRAPILASSSGYRRVSRSRLEPLLRELGEAAPRRA